MPERARVLYVSYDGLMEPLGRSQVLQYLKKLARTHDISLLSFEKSRDWKNIHARETLRREAREAGIHWTALRYHKFPAVPITAYDIAMGFLVGSWIILRRGIGIVHARSYIAGIMGLAFKRCWGGRLLFDMRGFWADERAEAAQWSSRSMQYRCAKWFERRMLTEADAIVSLTESGVAAMKEFPYLKGRSIRFEVIPTCVNMELFHPDGRPSVSEDPERPFVVGFVGAVPLWYMFNEMAKAFEILRAQRPDSRLLIVNKGARLFIRDRIREAGIPDDLFRIKEAQYEEVPREMRVMDAAIFFIRPVFSKRASSPTRLGEFLACGVPCLINAGVGDIDERLEREGAVVLLRDFSESEMGRAVQALLDLAFDPMTRSRCMETARKFFSLEEGVRKYDRLYAELSGKAGAV